MSAGANQDAHATATHLVFLIWDDEVPTPSSLDESQVLSSRLRPLLERTSISQHVVRSKWRQAQSTILYSLSLLTWRPAMKMCGRASDECLDRRALAMFVV